MINQENKSNLKFLWILLGFPIILIFSSVNISAAACTILASNNCGGSNHIVMYLSASDNAHGALASQPSGYPQVLCCDFGGGSTTCGASNEILSLSSSTNAHAEEAQGTGYSNKVCYDSVMNCQGGLPDYYVPDANDVDVITLSSSTNAHLGNGYFTSGRTICDFIQQPVCGNGALESGEQCDDNNLVNGDGCSSTCQLEPSVYWANDAAGTQPITSKTINIGDTVYIIGKNFNNYVGSFLFLELYEDDSLDDDTIIGSSAAQTVGVNATGFVSFGWVVTQSEWDKGWGFLDEESSGTDAQEHYFMLRSQAGIPINGAVSGNLQLSLVPPGGTPAAYWSNTYGNLIREDNVSLNEFILMKGRSLSSYEGQTLSLMIYEDDSGKTKVGDDLITTKSKVVGGGNIDTSWEVTAADLQNTNEYTDPTNYAFDDFYFRIKESNGNTIVTSDYLTVTIISEVACLNINACSDYEQAECTMADVCGKAPNGPLPPNTDCNDPNTDCGCIWNAGAGTCDVNVQTTDTQTYCGDNITQRPNDAEMSEDCDPNNGTEIFWFSTNEDSCIDLSTNLNPPIDSFNGGTLNCIACAYETSSCTSTVAPYCGNNAIDQLNESCDTNQLAGRSCTTEGWREGAIGLGCYSSTSATPCELDFSGCLPPTNTYADCVGQSCTIKEGTGTDSCAIAANCVTEPVAHAECVNNACVVVAGEGVYECAPINDDCDIPSANHAVCVGQSCMLAVGEGTDECTSSTDCIGEPLAHTECNNNMCEIVAGAGENECAPVGGSCDVIVGGYCGDGIIQQPNAGGKNEYCDSSNLGAETSCVSLNGAIYQSGPISCKSDCTYDVSSCVFKPGIVPECGDDVINQLNESCDNGFYYQGHTCQSLGYDGGTLGCTSTCKLDNSQCIAPPPGTTGSCQITQETTDTCDDGYLSFKWTGKWIGTERIEPEATDCEESGSDVIPCPVLVQLPFFSIGNAIAVVIIAILIYLIISRRKQKGKGSRKR